MGSRFLSPKKSDAAQKRQTIQVQLLKARFSQYRTTAIQQGQQ